MTFISCLRRTHSVYTMNTVSFIMEYHHIQSRTPIYIYKNPIAKYHILMAMGFSYYFALCRICGMSMADKESRDCRVFISPP